MKGYLKKYQPKLVMLLTSYMYILSDYILHKTYKENGKAKGLDVDGLPDPKATIKQLKQLNL